MAFLDELRSHGAYFFFNDVEHTTWLHQSICLAEGLDELGVPCVANVNAYKRPYRDGSWLFRHTTSAPTESWITVLDMTSAGFGVPSEHGIDDLMGLRHRSAVFYMCDNVNLQKFPPELPVFAPHHNNLIDLGDKRIPWPFGLSRAMLDGIEAARSSSPPRRDVILRNFRPTWNQGVRDALDHVFVRRLAAKFAIDRALDSASQHFTESHYARLASALGCLAYGGMFMADCSDNKFCRPPMPKGMVNSEWPVIGRWDSWRFWESLAAGCLTIALDFDAYDFGAPVKPVDRQHYIGLRLDDLDSALAFLSTAGKERLLAIGEAGRRWVLDHYAPRAVALRFIDHMRAIYP